MPASPVPCLLVKEELREKLEHQAAHTEFGGGDPSFLVGGEEVGGKTEKLIRNPRGQQPGGRGEQEQRAA